MFIKQNGNLRKHPKTALYTHIYALYILHICTCTCILDVSKRGVLGSADDDIAFFLHIMILFIVHGSICLEFTCVCCKFAVPYTQKTRDGRKCVKNFGGSGLSGQNKQGQNARRGFSHDIPHDNETLINRMVTSENGITHKRYGIFQYSVIFD